MSADRFRLPPSIQNALAPYLAEQVMSELKEDPSMAGELFANGKRRNMLQWLVRSAQDLEFEPVAKSRIQPYIEAELDAIETFGEAMAVKYQFLSDKEIDEYYERNQQQ